MTMRVVGAGVEPDVRAFIVSCLRPAADGARLCDGFARAARGRDVDDVIAVATDYGVAPTVATACVKAAVPEPRFRDISEHSALHAMTLQVALARTCAVLAGASVPVLAMKGAALQAGGHMPMGERHCDDIDVLVDHADAVRAVRALVDGGFAALHDYFDDTALLRSPEGVAIDLHRASPGRKHSLTALWAQTEVAVVEGVDVRIPTAPALLEQLCDHVVVRHRAYPRYWPKHVHDVAVLVARGAAADLSARLVGADDDAVSRGWPGPVLLSLAVTAGAIDDDAPAAVRALADLLVLPSRLGAAAHGARFVANRAIAEVQRGGVRAFWPDAGWLKTSGDLTPGRSLWQARGARLRRIAGLTRGRP
jgi:hypothetical protein